MAISGWLYVHRRDLEFTRRVLTGNAAFTAMGTVPLPPTMRAVTLLASYVPARRASRLDAWAALREN